MQNDKTTLKDLSIFPSDGSEGVFGLIDRTATQAGRAALKKHILHPPGTYEQLIAMQETIRFWHNNHDLWPTNILNGTIVMLEKFYESADTVSVPPGGFAKLLGTLLQKVFNNKEYKFARFSMSHLSDMLNGCSQLAAIPEQREVPALLLRELETIKNELQHRLIEPIMTISDHTRYSDLIQLQYGARRELKNAIHRLIASYARIDAWQSMAKATAEHGWAFPTITAETPVSINAEGLYHPLLSTPITYDISFDEKKNFLLLTGANMSGKTTFLRALGVNSLLAHLGMGVAASRMQTSFMHGIITNMHAEDNILKGESYFFAEVQRMKQIAARLSKQRPHLALMDELFKGTNVHDACECTKAVVEGLMNHPNHIMMLSTHLYEVAQQFKEDSRVVFSHFVTNISEDGNYTFTYKLKEGISNDRIGYLILQQEGVIAMLGNK